MLVNQNKVSDLIPHKSPMIMVDGLLECTDTKAITTLYITKDNILVKNGYFTESGILENIAQSVGLMSGWLAQKGINENGIQLGVIGGIKNFILYFLPKIHSSITTKINVLHEIFNASIIEASVFENGKESAKCEMKVFKMDTK